MLYYIKADKIVIGNGDALEHAAVVVNNGRISQIGESIPVPPDAQVIHLKGSTLLPGLVDAHSHAGEDSCREEGISQQHLQPDARKALRGYVSLQKDLRCGTTTIRLLGDGFGCLDKHLREAISAGEIEGPHILAACMALRPSNGTAPEIGFAADGADEVRKRVREAIFSGADVIKLFISNVSRGSSYLDYLKGDLTRISSYTYPEIAAAVEEAHRSGLKVACHCLGGDVVQWALKAGVDSLEHCNLITSEDIDHFLENHAFISDPNLHLFFDPEKGFESAANKTHKWNELPEWWHEKVYAARENTRTVFREALKRGVPFALGTDLNHGGLWLECKYFVQEIGATPMQAIQAVTLNGALCCGIEDQAGSVEVGKRADLISVDGDPTKNILQMKQVGFVMKEGRVVFHANSR